MSRGYPFMLEPTRVSGSATLVVTSPGASDIFVALAYAAAHPVCSAGKRDTGTTQTIRQNPHLAPCRNLRKANPIHFGDGSG